MKVNDFINKASEVEKLPTLYGWGKYMNAYNKQYLLCDCSGLIKGILWGYPKNGKYKNNGVLDMNADTMISKCSKVTTDFSKLKKGWLVWMKGHIGIYIGNGIVIESSPIWENGIQRTFCKQSGYINTYKLKERQWTKCGQFDLYIDYDEKAETTPIYQLVTSVKIYMSASDALNNKNQVGTYSPGEYYIYNVSQGMINITKNKGNPGGWMNPSENQFNIYYPPYEGTSIKLDYILEKVGVPEIYFGHWKKRKTLASNNGISNYTGTASQNQTLITLAKTGKLKKI